MEFSISMHDFSSKTLSSNMTTRRIRLLVEKTAKSDTWSILFLFEVRHLDLVEKKNDQVSEFAFFETSIHLENQLLF